MLFCRHLLFRRSCLFLTAKQGIVSTNEPATVQGFYSCMEYDDLGAADVPDLQVSLLPFQREGVYWMMLRERHHVGGIMADQLGMGKTIQMIGLCLSSHQCNKVVRERHIRNIQTKAQNYRLLTVIRQMQRITVVANCSRINRPATDLRSLLSKVECSDANHSDQNMSDVRTEVEKWLRFTGKFHPTYEKRALAFLDDEQKRSFDLIESKELRTLVVVPAALMLQWKSEIESKVKSSRGLRVYLYHGQSKVISNTELELYDFVITTYDTLANSASGAFAPAFGDSNIVFNRREAGPLFHIRWKRIILDEAHMVRHSRTQRWRAVKELQGVHRWAVTATPLHNNIEDIQNLLHFVGLPRLPVLPGSNPEEILNDRILQRGIARSLQPAFLRRGPVMIRNGKREVLVELPPKTEKVVMKRFSSEESKRYNSILARSRSALESSERKEAAFHIFAMMTRLRQACCHPWISRDRALTVSVCGICKSEAVSSVLTKCGHYFCYECLLLRFRDAVDGDSVAVRLECPTCGEIITKSSVFRNQTLTSAERIAKLKNEEVEVSTKLQMILDSIQAMKKNCPDDKMIIFSHFTSFMDVISVALDNLDIAHLRLDGTMSLSSRNLVIRCFQSSDDVRVILASKTATGVGLNLTAANHVLVVDPWWNPAIEEQAVHRCYRIGQRKHVHVKRIIIEDTIEQYCYEICRRKKEFGDAILRAATKGESGASLATSKLRELLSRLQFVPDSNKTSDNVGDNFTKTPREDCASGSKSSR
ncbi:DNA repair protein, putative [Trypanosoma brucei gambiense DAL972]|uniref:DNA repair protein, putative n=1 Tax=Trypanosoma brucei gambiense (strain MHOM/CI/86/DAL972) TaxID=679716 RepID=D0A7Z6_TRYB9|nr:DNA repair protein, putative [Trypanosoma brucei gambiense DAL972]CBH17797.1 DNA repair protein, putative [Trypanosoma brucei gambiense DAL972]|eukprot:XP_011780061.1 DNA repair protein, putative [Trypanosoma brucei gambiense DAL972]